MTTDFKIFLEELLHEKHNLVPTAEAQAAICSIIEVADFKQNLQQTDVSGSLVCKECQKRIITEIMHDDEQAGMYDQ